MEDGHTESRNVNSEIASTIGKTRLHNDVATEEDNINEHMTWYGFRNDSQVGVKKELKNRDKETAKSEGSNQGMKRLRKIIN